MATVMIFGAVVCVIYGIGLCCSMTPITNADRLFGGQ